MKGFHAGGTGRDRRFTSSDVLPALRYLRRLVATLTGEVEGLRSDVEELEGRVGDLEAAEERRARG